MDTQKPRTWKFYALIWLVDFVAMFVSDLVVGHAIEDYPKHTFLLGLAEATIFTALFWLILEKPFKKNK